MSRILTLERYKDERGNEIVYDGELAPKTDIRFQDGSNNRVVIDASADLRHLLVIFTGNNGLVEIGPTNVKRAGLRFEVRVGHDSVIEIAENVGCAGAVFISATEGEDVFIGRDVMFAKGIEIRTDDTHAIYDVHSGGRVNISQSIHVGEHVWIAKHATVMGGVTIGAGTVIGFRSVVTSSIPNNVVAVGSPARIVRRDIAWERPETPYKRADETWPKPGGKSTKYWNVTDDESVASGKTAISPPPAAPKTAGGAARAAKVAARPAASSLRSTAGRVRGRVRRELARRRASR